MKLEKYLLLLIAIMLIAGCDMRLRAGEDITFLTYAEEKSFVSNLLYVKDSKGICYAVLNNKTDGFRNTFTFSSVDCVRAGL